jgi:hypothetical protein
MKHLDSVKRRTFLARSAAACGAAAGGLVLATTPSRAADPSEALDVGSETLLFLDDWIVHRSEGFTRRLHAPAKQGLIKTADGRDWDRGDVYHGNCVCRDKAGRFHMTYRYIWSDPSVRDLHPGIGDDKAHWFRESTAYATSDDGLHWHRPTLGLLDGPAGFRRVEDFPFEIPAGLSKQNNLGCPFDFIYDLAAHGNLADPDKRFLLRVVRREDTHPFAAAVESQMYYAADWPGFAGDPRWRERLTPLPGANLSPRGFKALSGYDHRQQLWFVVGQDTIANWRPRGGRDIARFTSPDLVAWQGPELVLAVADDEARTATDWVEYMDMTAYRVGGPKSGLWLGQLVVFHSDRSSDQYMMPTIPDVWRKGTTELRLVTSRDAGKTWQPVAGKQVWLPHHVQEHGFDRLVFASCPVRVGDELWFYYSAWDGDHLVFNRDGSLFEPGFIRRGRTARATLRLDGYASLQAGPAGGRLTTRPLTAKGQDLVVNVDAPKGALQVSLEDPFGQAYPGFAVDDCIAAGGDSVALAIRWRDGRQAGLLAGKAVRIRCELAAGELYSLSFAV